MRWQRDHGHGSRELYALGAGDPHYTSVARSLEMRAQVPEGVEGVEGERGGVPRTPISCKLLGRVAVPTLCKTKEANTVGRLVLVHQARCAEQLGDALGSA